MATTKYLSLKEIVEMGKAAELVGGQELGKWSEEFSMSWNQFLKKQGFEHTRRDIVDTCPLCGSLRDFVVKERTIKSAHFYSPSQKEYIAYRSCLKVGDCNVISDVTEYGKL